MAEKTFFLLLLFKRGFTFDIRCAAVRQFCLIDGRCLRHEHKVEMNVDAAHRYDELEAALVRVVDDRAGAKLRVDKSL